MRGKRGERSKRGGCRCVRKQKEMMRKRGKRMRRWEKVREAIGKGKKGDLKGRKRR